jgi:hypothetical protein
LKFSSIAAFLPFHSKRKKNGKFWRMKKNIIFGDILYLTLHLQLKFISQVSTPSGTSSKDNISWSTKYHQKVSL